MGYYQEKYTFHQISIFGFNILVRTQKVQNENISTEKFLENQILVNEARKQVSEVYGVYGRAVNGFPIIYYDI